MDRKSILALVLIAVIILALPYYQKFLTGDQPVQKRTVTDSLTRKTVQPEPAEKKQVVQEKSIPEADPREEQSIESFTQTNVVIQQDSTQKEFRIGSEKISVVLSNNGGGSIKEFILNNYDKDETSKVNMVDPAINNDVFLAFQCDHIRKATAFGNFDQRFFLSSVFVRDVFYEEHHQDVVLVLRRIHGAT